MTTNEQIETAAILQMRKDLDEARAVLLGVLDALEIQGGFPMTSEVIKDFLARTEHETANR